MTKPARREPAEPTPLSRRQAADRHVLVLTLWLGLSLPVVALLHHGLGEGSVGFVVAGFGLLLTAFIGHVIVNVIYATTFSAGELALGLVLYALALVALGLTALLAPTFSARDVLAVGLGLLVLGGAVIFYMVTHFGLGRVFSAFDVVRSFGEDEPERRGRWERRAP